MADDNVQLGEMRLASPTVRLSERGQARLRLAAQLFDTFHRAGKTPSLAMDDALATAREFLERAEALEEKERIAAEATLRKTSR